MPVPRGIRDEEAAREVKSHIVGPTEVCRIANSITAARAARHVAMVVTTPSGATFLTVKL